MNRVPRESLRGKVGAGDPRSSCSGQTISLTEKSIVHCMGDEGCLGLNYMFSAFWAHLLGKTLIPPE